MAAMMSIQLEMGGRNTLEVHVCVNTIFYFGFWISLCWLVIVKCVRDQLTREGTSLILIDLFHWIFPRGRRGEKKRNVDEYGSVAGRREPVGTLAAPAHRLICISPLDRSMGTGKERRTDRRRECARLID